MRQNLARLHRRRGRKQSRARHRHNLDLHCCHITASTPTPTSTSAPGRTLAQPFADERNAREIHERNAYPVEPKVRWNMPRRRIRGIVVRAALVAVVDEEGEAAVGAGGARVYDVAVDFGAGGVAGVWA